MTWRVKKETEVGKEGGRERSTVRVEREREKRGMMKREAVINWENKNK